MSAEELAPFVAATIRDRVVMELSQELEELQKCKRFQEAACVIKLGDMCTLNLQDGEYVPWTNGDDRGEDINDIGDCWKLHLPESSRELASLADLKQLTLSIGDFELYSDQDDIYFYNVDDNDEDRRDITLNLIHSTKVFLEVRCQGPFDDADHERIDRCSMSQDIAEHDELIEVMDNIKDMKPSTRLFLENISISMYGYNPYLGRLLNRLNLVPSPSNNSNSNPNMEE